MDGHHNRHQHLPPPSPGPPPPKKKNKKKKEKEIGISRPKSASFVSNRKRGYWDSQERIESPLSSEGLRTMALEMPDTDMGMV